MRQFVVLAILGFSALALADPYGPCSRQAARKGCPYGQVHDSNGCRLNRCYKSCTEEIYCNAGTVSKRIDRQCVCEDSATVCPIVDCDLRSAESLLLDPPCNSYLVDQRTGCLTCDCDCRQHNGECRDMNCAHGQLHRDDGCRLCECRTCEDLNCGAECQFGYKKDSYGCKTCSCKPNPLCETKTCQYGFKKDSQGRYTCECACPPACRKACPYGFVLDDDSCPSCECACPSMDSCNKDCEFGYVQDGPCDTCACKPNPQCPALTCEFGFKTDQNGNSRCECRRNPDCPNKSCSNGFVLGSNGISTCECKCGPVCQRHCPYGDVLDGEDCPTCDCNPPPCPVCPRNCKYGFVPGNNDCNTCDCKPAPVHDGMCPANRFANRGDSCQDDGDCDRDEKCCSKGNAGRAQCLPAIFDIPHAGKCPKFILLDLTPITHSRCFSDYECGSNMKCCNVGGVKRCVTTGASGRVTGSGAGHRQTGSGRGSKSGHSGSHSGGHSRSHRGGHSGSHSGGRSGSNSGGGNGSY